MQFRNPRAIGIASLLHLDTIATALGFLNRVDPQTCDLTIMYVHIATSVQVHVCRVPTRLSTGGVAPPFAWLAPPNQL